VRPAGRRHLEVKVLCRRGALRDGSVVFWKHVNLHGEFDFSDVEANSLEFLLPEILSVNMAKFLEVKKDVTHQH